MSRSRQIYYVAFPLAVVGLCVFSYYLGWSRGKQTAARPASEPNEVTKAEPHEAGGELTFFKTLKAVDDPEEEAQRPAAGKAEGSASSMVQVSAFRDIGKAHEMVAELKNRGFRAFSKSSASGGGENWYRVYVGPFASKNEASSTLRDLSEKGFGGGFITDLETW